MTFEFVARGGRYSEEDAKVIVLQILSIVSFCHLQGVAHRDLKPEVDYAMPMLILHIKRVEYTSCTLISGIIMLVIFYHICHIKGDVIIFNL